MENFGVGLLGGVVLVDPETGQPYRPVDGDGGTGEFDLARIPTLNLAKMAPGGVFVVKWDADHWEDLSGATITTRPSDRTDLVMQCVTTGVTPPSFAINGLDMLLRVS